VVLGWEQGNRGAGATPACGLKGAAEMGLAATSLFPVPSFVAAKTVVALGGECAKGRHVRFEPMLKAGIVETANVGKSTFSCPGGPMPGPGRQFPLLHDRANVGSVAVSDPRLSSLGCVQLKEINSNRVEFRCTSPGCQRGEPGEGLGNKSSPPSANRTAIRAMWCAASR